MNHKQILKRRAEREIARHGNASRAAAALNVSSAHFHNVLELGMDSPTLRRKWGIRKGQRTRFTADADPELIATFDALCQEIGMTRSELLAEMVDLWAVVWLDTEVYNGQE